MVTAPRDTRDWAAKLPKGKTGSRTPVINPFAEAVEAARKTSEAHHGFRKPTPNHPSGEGKKRLKTWGDVYNRNAPTLDRNEREDPRDVWQAPKRKSAKDA